MRRRQMFFLAGALSLSLMGCSDRLASPAANDSERLLLTERVLALQARVGETGRITLEQRRELDDITRDIAAWQARTGRTDLSVSKPERLSTPSTSALVTKGPTESCSPCPAVKSNGGYICFLDSQSPCGAPGDFIQQVCTYACIYLGPVPITR